MSLLSSYPSPPMISAILIITALITIFKLSLRISRAHPLRDFPGPRLAALTTWYCAYFDIVKHGSLLRQVEYLHKRYGPVVRIGPNELSFSTPKAYFDIFAPGSKFTKDPACYQGFGVSQSAFGCIDVQESKIRRDRLKPLFSRRAILDLGHVVEEKADRLVSRLTEECKDGKHANLFMAFRCTSLDIITSYCLGQSFNALDTPEFKHPFLVSLQHVIPYFWILKYLPFLTPFVTNPPEWAYLLRLVNRNIFEFRRHIAQHIDRFVAKPNASYDSEQKTIYHHLVSSIQSEGHRDVTHEDLFQEALAAVLAGSDTLGNACTVGFFHVLSNPEVLRKLVEELDQVWPDAHSRVDIQTLEKLPYLTAVIKESLRFGHGVVSSIPRIVGPEDSIIDGVNVPAGTIVSMSPVFVHTNPLIFQDPAKFSPERWLQPNAHELEPYLVAFSRGPRSCLGMNLAWHELYTLFGTVFRKLDLQPFDMQPGHYVHFDSFFTPVHRGNHLRVIVRKRFD